MSDCHHVGITKYLIPLNRREMMDKSNQPFVATVPDESSKCPATCLPRNYQVASWRNFKIRQPKNFSLQPRTAIQLIN